MSSSIFKFFFLKFLNFGCVLSDLFSMVLFFVGAALVYTTCTCALPHLVYICIYIGE